MTYGPAMVLMIFALVVIAGANASSPVVIVPFLVIEAIAVVVYATHISHDIKRRRRR